MKREPKTKRTEIDLTKPVVSLAQVNDTDCFGNLWDMKEPDCISCHDCTLCGLMFERSGKKKRVAKVTADKQLIELQLIDERVIDLLEDGWPVANLLRCVKHLSDYNDAQAVDWIKAFVQRTEGLSVKDGIIQWQPNS